MNEEELNQMDKEELLGVIKAQQYEIERLNKRVKECEEAYLRTRHQYSELESKYVIDEYIINELEKWLEDYHNNTGLGEYETGIDDAISDVIKKLQELKGDSSNE